MLVNLIYLGLNILTCLLKVDLVLRQGLIPLSFIKLGGF